MTDFFKTVRAYLRGKWWRKGVSEPRVYTDEEVAFWTWTNADYDRSVRNGFLSPEHERDYNIRTEIARLRRNKKKHSHLQKQLDDLLNGGAQISDQQTETTK